MAGRAVIGRRMEGDAVGLRPMLPVDVPVLAAVFQASVHELGAEDYGEEQCAAWAETADDEVAFGAKLRDALTLVATIGGAPVGFISLETGGVISMLYVLPAAARRGVATRLLDAIEKLAAARSTRSLAVDSSDTARPFFEARGFDAVQRQTTVLGGAWFGNTRMEKRLV